MPSTLKSEAWDGVTAPAIPSGWNADANYLTSTSFYQSSPNGLMLSNSASSGANYYITWGTADGVSGQVRASTRLRFGGAADGNRIGLTARGTGSTLDSSSTTQYVLWCKTLSSGGTKDQVTLAKIASGSETQLGANLMTGTNRFSAGSWYRAWLVCNGNSLTAQVQRLSDGYWLQGNTWVSSEAVAVTATDATLSTSGYAGLVMQTAGGAQNLYTDDWLLEELDPSLWPYAKRMQPVPYPDNRAYLV